MVIPQELIDKLQDKVYNYSKPKLYNIDNASYTIEHLSQVLDMLISGEKFDHSFKISFYNQIVYIRYYIDDLWALDYAVKYNIVYYTNVVDKLKNILENGMGGVDELLEIANNYKNYPVYKCDLKRYHIREMRKLIKTLGNAIRITEDLKKSIENTIKNLQENVNHITTLGSEVNNLYQYWQGVTSVLQDIKKLKGMRF